MAVAELHADEASFRRFHTVDLPRRIAAGNGALAFADVERLGAIGLRTPAGSFTYRPDHGSVSVLPGEAEADTVVEMDLESWHGLISDLDTAPGLFYGGRVTVVDGKPLRFVRWEPGLRALFHGVPVFDPDTADLRDRSGAPLDPTRSFVIGDLEADAATARHQFDTAGFLWVTGVFDPSEVAELRADADRFGARGPPRRRGVVVGPRRRRRSGAHPRPPRRGRGPGCGRSARTRGSSGSCRWSRTRFGRISAPVATR